MGRAILFGPHQEPEISPTITNQYIFNGYKKHLLRFDLAKFLHNFRKEPCQDEKSIRYQGTVLRQ